MSNLVDKPATLSSLPPKVDHPIVRHSQTVSFEAFGGLDSGEFISEKVQIDKKQTESSESLTKGCITNTLCFKNDCRLMLLYGLTCLKL